MRAIERLKYYMERYELAIGLSPGDTTPPHIEIQSGLRPGGFGMPAMVFSTKEALAPREDWNWEIFIWVNKKLIWRNSKAYIWNGKKLDEYKGRWGKRKIEDEVAELILEDMAIQGFDQARRVIEERDEKAI